MRPADGKTSENSSIGGLERIQAEGHGALVWSKRRMRTVSDRSLCYGDTDWHPFHDMRRVKFSKKNYYVVTAFEAMS